MTFFSDLAARLGALVRRGRIEHDTAEELRFHLDMETEKLVRAGLTPDEARRRARLSLGGVAQTQEEVRDARGVRLIEDLARDLAFAWRQLRRTPGFTIVAVLTLALGIGANTAIFSVLDGVLLRSAPVPDPGGLVMVWETDRITATTREPGSWPDFVDLRDRSRTVRVAAMYGADLTLLPEQGEPTLLKAMAVSHDYFDLLGVAAVQGRGFLPEEDRAGAPRVVVLSEGLWRGRYRADPSIVGSTLRLNGEPHLVVGVVPAAAGFGLDQVHSRAAYHAPYKPSGELDAWVPMAIDEGSAPRSRHGVLMLGRLKPGATMAGAQQELAGIAADLERTFPNDNTARGVNVEPFEQVVFGEVRPILLMLIAAVTLVLLVACVNVANLLLARGAVRAREMAVRRALGAEAGRVGRQLIVETVLLALVGALAGIGVAYAGLRALLALAPADLPRGAEIGIDLRVLGFTLVISLLVGVVFGLIPAREAARVDPMTTMRAEGRVGSGGVRRRRFRQGLVVAELALSVMLVLGAGLLMRSFVSVLRVDTGFHAEGVLKADYQLPAGRYPRDFARFPAWTEIHAFTQTTLERVRRIPGVQDAAVASSHPLDAGYTNTFVVVGREAEAQDWPEISFRNVTAEYFSTMGLAVRSGRVFTASDDAAAPVVGVINEAAVRRFFPDQDPIGQEIRFWGINRRIIGVVADERIHGLTASAPPVLYMAFPQAPMSSGSLLVRTTGNPLAIEGAVRQAIRATDPELAVYGVEPLSETLIESVSERRFAMIVLAAFAAVTLLLALVGIHGVLSYTTAQRTHEIGIRVALGASQGSVSRLVLRSGLLLAVGGIGLGLLGSMAASGLLGALLHGVSALDPVTYVVVPILVLSAAAFAVWIPARRAARVDPMEALRSD